MADYTCAGCGTTFEDTAEHGRAMDDAYGVPLCPDCEFVAWLGPDDSWEDLQDLDDEYRRYEREALDWRDGLWSAFDDPLDEVEEDPDADLIAEAQRDLAALANRFPC